MSVKQTTLELNHDQVEGHVVEPSLPLPAYEPNPAITTLPTVQSGCTVLEPDRDFVKWSYTNPNPNSNQQGRITLKPTCATEDLFNHWEPILHSCRPSQEVFIWRSGAADRLDMPSGWYTINGTTTWAATHAFDVTLTPHVRTTEGPPFLLATRGGVFEYGADKLWYDRRSGVINPNSRLSAGQVIDLTQAFYDLSARVTALERSFGAAAASTGRVQLALAQEVKELRDKRSTKPVGKKGPFGLW